jgi:hypothetical protein
MGSPAATRSATGFGALYDKAGKLVDETEQIRTGGPKGRRDFRFHIERQVLERFRTKGLLKEGSTVVIVSDTQRPVCGFCRPYIDRLLSKLNLRIRIVYRAPGGHREVFGAANSNAVLESGGITPEGKFPHLRSTQQRLPWSPAGMRRVRRRKAAGD